MDNDALLALLRADGDIITERLDHGARTRADRVFLHYGEDRITHAYAEFGRLTAQDVHDHARTAMPEDMRPRIVRIVKDLPRTPTDKIEKYELRKQILDERGHSPS